MNTPQIHYIWTVETGIADLPDDWQTLAAPEIESIGRIWAEQRERLKGSSQLREFNERLTREWSIETGEIEDLYHIDRGITQTLIERGFQSELLTRGSTNRPARLVIEMLCDQQEALEGVFDFIAQRRELTCSYIRQLHAALTRSQESTDARDPFGNRVEVVLLKGEWKSRPNYPVRDGVTIAYCPPEQVASEMDRLVAMHDDHRRRRVSPEVEAAWLHHRFTQIHPFQDGNGRVARTLASLVLVRAGLFPLVVTRDDKSAYLDALEAADDGILQPLVALFATLQRNQFLKATALSENVLSTGTDMASALGLLDQAAARSSELHASDKLRAMEYSRSLEALTKDCLEASAPAILDSLRKIAATSTVEITQSHPTTNHFFRAQIARNAHDYLHYFADTQTYRAWVCLHLQWGRQAQIVFAFHAIGRQFSGSMACAPFMEILDSDEARQLRSTFVPLAHEPFLFFYEDSLASLTERFIAWRDQVLVRAMKDLAANL